MIWMVNDRSSICHIWFFLIAYPILFIAFLNNFDLNKVNSSSSANVFLTYINIFNYLIIIFYSGSNWSDCLRFNNACSFANEFSDFIIKRS